MTALMKQQSAQFAQALAGQQQKFSTLLAKNNQQQLTSQLQQQAQARVGAAQQNQAALSGGLADRGNALGPAVDSQGVLGEYGKNSLDTLHAKLSKQSGFFA